MDIDFVDISTSDFKNMECDQAVDFTTPCSSNNGEKIKKGKLKKFLKKNIGALIKCPISQCVFFNPIVASDGFIYEDTSFNHFMKSSYYHNSPLTRESLSKKTIVIPLVRDIIEFGDELKLKICDEKFISTDNFIDNAEIIIGSIKNKNYSFVQKFKHFVLELSDKSNSIFIAEIFKIQDNSKEYSECVKYIISNSNISFKTDNGKNIFHIICENCFSQDIYNFIFDKILLLNIDDFNTEDSIGFLPINYACHYSNFVAIKKLLDYGFSFDVVNPNTNLPIISLLQNTKSDDLTIIKVIDNIGIEGINRVNSSSSYNTYPLMEAIKVNKLQIVKYMLEKGASLDITIDGYTPLHYALRYGNDMLSALLINKTTNYEVENNIGWRPIHVACRYSNINIIDMLISKDVLLNVPVKKYNGRDVQYLPLNLVELNEKIKESESIELIDLMIQIMQIQESSI